MSLTPTPRAIAKLETELERKRRQPTEVFRLLAGSPEGFALCLDTPTPEEIVLSHEGTPLLVVEPGLAERVSDAARDVGKGPTNPTGSSSAECLHREDSGAVRWSTRDRWSLVDQGAVGPGRRGQRIPLASAVQDAARLGRPRLSPGVPRRGPMDYHVTRARDRGRGVRDRSTLLADLATTRIGLSCLGRARYDVGTRRRDPVFDDPLDLVVGFCEQFPDRRQAQFIAAVRRCRPDHGG